MGSHSRIQGAVLIAALSLIVGASAEAASRQNVSINPGAAARGGGGPTSSGGTLSIPGPMQGEYIPRTGSGTKGVPVNVQPRIDFSIPRTLNHVKSGLRAGLPAMAGAAAIGFALDAVDLVLDPENNRAYKRQTAVDGEVVAEGGEFSPPAICQFPASQTLGVYTLHTSAGGTRHLTVVLPGGATGNPGGGYIFVNNCTNTNLGYQHGEGGWPGAWSKQLAADQELDTIRVPATDADFDRLGDYISGQDAEFIRDVLRETCAASPLSPDRCFQELMDGSALSGPSTVPGGSETTTSTTIGPDGTPQTTTTTTTTEYNIRYGDSHFDYSQRKTSIVNHPDGSTTETTTEETDDVVDQDQESGDFADTAFPEVPSFYEAKYPDGLQGVWNDARSRLDQSDFLSFLRSFVPSFSGACPAWSIGFNIATWANYGTQSFSSLCYVFDFVKVVLLVTAAFMSRRIIFGG